MDVQQVETDQKPKVELWQFIEKYQKTIAVVGVFVALGLFWKTIYAKDTVPYIAYLCFLITIPLLIEVWRGYDYGSASLNLKVFINIFSGIILLTASNLLFEYPEHFASVIAGLLWTVTGLGLFALLDKAGRYLKTRKYNKAVQYRLEMIEKYGSTDTTNEIVDLNNKSLQSYYKMINSAEFLGILFSIVIAFTVFFYTETFLKALVNTRGVQDVTPPPVRELEKPTME